MRNEVLVIVTGLGLARSPGWDWARPWGRLLPARNEINRIETQTTNALKHAFTGRSSGEVAVRLTPGAGHGVCLTVRDNGGGLAAGQDWRQSSSLGLQLVQMLAGQLGATVEVRNDQGTEFAVAFEVPEETRFGEEPSPQEPG